MRLSRHRWRPLPILGGIPSSVELNRFDVIVVHYTLVASREYFLSAQSRARLADCRALKAIFIQDEYRHVNASMAAMREMGIGVLFTCVPEGEIAKVYAEEALPGVRKVNVLTGCVPEGLLKRPAAPPSQRPMLVGYRSRRLPFWLGRFGHEKYMIGARFPRRRPPLPEPRMRHLFFARRTGYAASVGQTSFSAAGPCSERRAARA